MYIWLGVLQGCVVHGVRFGTRAYPQSHSSLIGESRSDLQLIHLHTFLMLKFFVLFEFCYVIKLKIDLTCWLCFVICVLLFLCVVASCLIWCCCLYVVLSICLCLSCFCSSFVNVVEVLLFVLLLLCCCFYDDITFASVFNFKS